MPHTALEDNPATQGASQVGQGDRHGRPRDGCGFHEEQGMKWISVDERMPEYGQEVLIYHILGDRGRCPRAYDVAWWHGEKGWTFPWCSREPQAPQWVTHWMPLPDSPSCESSQSE